MRPVCRLAIAGLVAGGPGAPLAAQGGGFVPPQPPCVLSAGHFKVTGGVLYLRSAADKPTQRDQQLAQAKRVLTEAIVQDKQDKNPAAWYYLGRYYFEVHDAVGADTAFAWAEALAPPCKEDIGRYREQLWVTALNGGLAAWQAGKDDSAVTLLHLAARLRPTHPRAYNTLAGFYVSKDNYDSALVYYRETAKLAVGDTAFERDRRDALSNAAKIELSRAQTNPAVQQFTRDHIVRDSLERAISDDSTVLAKLEAASASRRRRGTRLRPADQQLFARDSAARAQAVAQGRAALAALPRQMAADSAAAASANGPAIAAYHEFFAAYPDNVEAATWLATLLGQTGRAAEAAAVFDSLLARAKNIQAEDLFLAGQRLLGANLLRAGARALTLGLEKNPYRRDALYYLAAGYYTLRDSANLLPVAQRLVALEPLNRTSVRLLAAGWDFRGKRDSTVKYLALADSGIPVDIGVSSFAPDSAGYTLTALATNQRSVASKPFRVTFEFLDASGRVVATVPKDVPAIPSGESQQLDLRVTGKDIAGWRYRAS